MSATSLRLSLETALLIPIGMLSLAEPEAAALEVPLPVAGNREG